MPYRLTNIWIRAAVGEVTAMMFLPLVVLGLYELLCGDAKKWWLLAVGYSGLLHCHIVSCLLVMIFSVLMGIFMAEDFFREKRWVGLAKVLGSVLVFNAWYIVPFTYYYLRGNVELSALDLGYFEAQLMDFSQLFQLYVSGIGSTSYKYRNNCLGLSGLLCFGIGLIGIASRKREEGQKGRLEKFMAALFSCGILFLLPATKMVSWKLLRENTFLRWFSDTLQFPWRLLAFTVPCIMLAGVGWLFLSDRFRRYRAHIGMALVLSAFTMTQLFMTMYGINANTATREASMVRMPREYYIEGTNMEDLPSTLLLSDESKIRVEEWKRDGNHVSATLYCNDEGQYFEAPIFNYPGYRVTLADGTKLRVETGSNNRVRVYLPALGEAQEVTVRFAGKRMFYVAYGVSALALAALLFKLLADADKAHFKVLSVFPHNRIQKQPGKKALDRSHGNKYTDN